MFPVTSINIELSRYVGRGYAPVYSGVCYIIPSWIKAAVRGVAYAVNILGNPSTQGEELTRAVVIMSTSLGLCYGIAQFWKYTGTAPYPHGDSNRVAYALQQALIDHTKRPIDIAFYPLDSLRTAEPRRAVDNGHPVSGAVRDAARRLIDEAVSVAGYRKFELNPSKQSSEGDRCHHLFAVGDLKQNFEDDVPPKDAVVVGIDVDYYLRDPDVLLQYMRPMVLHTFNPIYVSGFDADATYSITGNNVVYEVGGGSSWVHPVWDWCKAGEYISSPVYERHGNWRKVHYVLNLLGFEKVGYHKIHHSRPWTDCPNRALVYTIPECTVWRCRWFATDIKHRRLQRINYTDPIRPDWNRFNHITANGTKLTSLGRQAEHVCVTIEAGHLETIMGLGSPQSVSGRLISLGYRSPEAAALLLQYYQGKTTPLLQVETAHRPVMPRVHWPVTSEADFPEFSARQYTRPILSDSMLVPMIKRWETMSETIERRVTFVANHKRPSDRIAALVKEFVILLNGPVRGCLRPLTIEETIERLDKPSQQLQIRAMLESFDLPAQALIKAFNKNEPAMKSPRLISGFSDIKFLVLVSQFTLSYTDVVLKADHNNGWYYPGRTPQEIVDGVCNFVTDCDGDVTETDFSNFDGSVSDWMQRMVAMQALLAAFEPEYHPTIRSFMDKIINCPAQSKRFGFRYDPGVGVKSGSPTTTPHNTIYNAAVDYVANRIAMPYGQPEEAYAMIGPKCGDDGLVRGTAAPYISKAARAFGLSLKTEHYNPEVGLCFLARVFVDPLNTTTTIQDPLRTLRKLHITMRDPTIPLADAACDRVEGYLCTDPLTPIISDYCKMVLRLHGPNATSLEVRQARRSRNKEKPYWWTCDGSWPQSQSDSTLMKTIILNRTGITEDDFERLLSRFQSMTDVWEPITIECDEHHNEHTIDEEGPVLGSVDASFPKLNEAKQIRANVSNKINFKDAKQTRPDSTTPTANHKRGRGSVKHANRGGAKQRAPRYAQYDQLPKQDQVEGKPNGHSHASQTERGSIPRGKPRQTDHTSQPIGDRGTFNETRTGGSFGGTPRQTRGSNNKQHSQRGRRGGKVE